MIRDMGGKVVIIDFHDHKPFKHNLLELCNALQYITCRYLSVLSERLLISDSTGGELCIAFYVRYISDRLWTCSRILYLLDQFI